MQRCPNSHPSDAAVVHISRSVRAKEVALEDAGGELDAVLDRGVERVHHRWPAVPLPVRLVHLGSFSREDLNCDIVGSVRHLFPEFLPGVVGSPLAHPDPVVEVVVSSHFKLLHR